MASNIWVPLESNPEVLTKYAHKLGLLSEYSFTDVWGLDEDSLSCIPKPVVAVLCLFPITDKYENFRRQEEDSIKATGQVVSKSVYFTQQTIPNACGTVALIHALANNLAMVQPGTIFQTFVESTSNLSSEDRATALEKDEKFSVVHEAIAQEGQSEIPENLMVNLHFICFVNVDGVLYELDGRKPFPINHGSATTETLIQDAAKVIQQFIARDPDETNFTVVALTKTAE